MENAQNQSVASVTLREMRFAPLFHMFLLRALEMPKMRYSPDVERPVRIKRKIRKRRYLSGKHVYKTEQMELTIPAKFKKIIEPFLNKDLRVEARVKGIQLIIDAKPAENTRENV